jgi:hypothetical protein
MMPAKPSRDWTREPSLPKALSLAFAPIHKWALGMAVGLTWGGGLALLTLFHVVGRPSPAPEIGLLAQYYYGYTVSWTGVLVGLFWGFVSGFVTGWFVAFVRNFTMATWLLFVRTKAELSQPFLDHI